MVTVYDANGSPVTLTDAQLAELVKNSQPITPPPFVPSNPVVSLTGGTWEITRDDIPTIAAELDDHLGLFGPPGTGKSHLAASLCKPGQTAYKIALTPETPSARLSGHWIPAKGGHFEWLAGPGQLAWANGGLLILDELSNASEDVMAYLLNLLDRGLAATETLPDGTVITPQPGFRAVGTMNDEPATLNLALRDRFGTWLPVTRPGTPQIQALDPDLREVVDAMYDSIPLGTSPDVSYRQAIRFQNYRQKFGEEKAALIICDGDAARARAWCQAIKVARVAASASAP